jgi:hypothetical protein
MANDAGYNEVRPCQSVVRWSGITIFEEPGSHRVNPYTAPDAVDWETAVICKFARVRAPGTVTMVIGAGSAGGCQPSPLALCLPHGHAWYACGSCIIFYAGTIDCVNIVDSASGALVLADT